MLLYYLQVRVLSIIVTDNKNYVVLFIYIQAGSHLGSNYLMYMNRQNELPNICIAIDMPYILTAVRQEDHEIPLVCR